MSLRMKPVHHCDLCDEQVEPDALRRLRTEAVVTSERVRSVCADVCDSCQDRPDWEDMMPEEIRPQPGRRTYHRGR